MKQQSDSIKESVHNINGELDRTQYVQELFDPVQTHAVYNVLHTEVERIKQILRDVANATRFRVVKTGISGICIVCFKLK